MNRGFGENRGYYNRKQNANVPTKSKSNPQSISSSSSSKHSSGKQSNSSTNNNSKKNGKKWSRTFDDRNKEDEN